jgi:histidinol-phosphate aminotransferase
MGLGTAAATAVPWPLAGVSSAAVFEPTRPSNADGFIRLNSNENVYGPSRKTLEAIRAAVSTANRYPYMHYDELTARIASFHRVKPEQVLLGCGSTEILRMAAQAFLGGGKKLVQASPTFEAAYYYAQSTGAEVESVPLTAEFAHDLDGMLAHASGSTALVYICNPNNPTASITPRKHLEDFLGKLSPAAYVLIDEAYHHYAGESSRYVSFLDHPINDQRLIVARTFSKVYGLAGLRLGYGIASPATAGRMRAFATLDNVNGMVVRAAIAALDDQQAVREFVKRNADERQEFFNQAMARMLKPIDSHANFVMMNTHHPVAEVIEHFQQNNILIGRRFPAMDTYMRVSLGTPDEMQAFWRAWDLLPYANMHHH